MFDFRNYWGKKKKKDNEFLRITTAWVSSMMSADAITKDLFSGERYYFGFINQVVLHRALRLMTTFSVSH